MTQERFDYFYKEFQRLNELLIISNLAKLGEKTKQNVFDAYKKSNNYNDLKKKIIKELGELNPEWTKNYTSYDNHPTKMLPFPEIYDLTELDENNFNFFFKEFEKLDNLFYKAFKIEEDKSFDKVEDDEEYTKPLDRHSEKKLKGFIKDYYSIDSVLEYNKQEEKIIKELGKINQKWIESKKETRLTKYEGDLKVKKFEFPYIYTLFDKLVQYDIEIQKLKKEQASSYMIDKKQYDFDKTKEKILKME
jgi:hypothetical protein